MAKTAKQKASEDAAEAINNDVVRVRITKMGDGKVSTGDHVANDGDLMFEAGEYAELPRVVALALEDRGFAEIEEAKKVEGGKDA